jgi:hypothetical protein
MMVAGGIGMMLEISDERLRRLYAYWTRKKGDRRVPSRADIAPEEITDVLPWVLLMERVENRIRYRLVGDEFRQVYGDKLIGMYLDEIDLDHITAAYIEEYERAARDLTPVARKWTFTKLSGRHLEYERLILPLSPDDKTVNMYLTGAVGFGFG